MAPRQASLGSWTAAMLAVVALAAAAVMVEGKCSKNYVYPYLNTCSNPATMGSSNYQLTGYEAFRGGLVSEYDESNQTFYVRFTGNILNQGDKFNLLPENLDASQVGKPLVLNTGAVFIADADAATELSRYWGWRQEGEDLWYLVAGGVDNAATFRFVQAPTSIINLPCTPSILLDFVCQAYYIISSPPGASTEYGGSGFQASLEDGITYIKLAPQGDNGNLAIVVKNPFILDPATGSRRAASSSAFSSHLLMPTE